MEKSRPRIDASRPLIIERPDLQSPPQRLLSTVLTLVFWAVWVYLWLPIIGLLGWLFGATRFYDEMIRLQGYKSLLELLGWYSLIASVLCGSLVCWALYNLRRFRGHERRVARPLVTLEQSAAAAGVEPLLLPVWRAARILEVAHDDDGRIAFVEAYPDLDPDLDLDPDGSPGRTVDPRRARPHSAPTQAPASSFVAAAPEH